MIAPDARKRLEEAIGLAAFKADYVWREANDASFPSDPVDWPLERTYHQMAGLSERWETVARCMLSELDRLQGGEGR